MNRFSTQLIVGQHFETYVVGSLLGFAAFDENSAPVEGEDESMVPGVYVTYLDVKGYKVYEPLTADTLEVDECKAVYQELLESVARGEVVIYMNTVQEDAYAKLAEANGG